jgi:glycosyltransferase involved in cell wall biosynthesis
MRILQLVDSLEAGGTERMAVNLANALASRLEYSALCTTRAEGPLKELLQPEVDYLFLNKGSKVDVGAWKRLHGFLKRNRIDLLHAHSSSYGLAVVMKCLLPGLQVVWHDHYGQSEFLSQRPLQPLKVLARFFSGSIAVNTRLKDWHHKVLGLQRVLYLPNFVSPTAPNHQITSLKGQGGKRIICLANWRPQKDHITLLQAFDIFGGQHPDWSLHLVGKHFGDAYEAEVRKCIADLKLWDRIFVYGSVKDVAHVLAQASIGVLSSRSEGLPLSLLEYGQSRLPVVVTSVGDCGMVVEDLVHGLLVAPGDPAALAEALKELISEETRRKVFSEALQKRVLQEFSEEASLDTLIRFYREL